VSKKYAASLVSCGADGNIRFWNLHKGRIELRIDGTNGRGEGIYNICSNSTNSRLYAADAAGWVTVWVIFIEVM
jgi:WD40 repeat protein